MIILIYATISIILHLRNSEFTSFIALIYFSLSLSIGILSIKKGNKNAIFYLTATLILIIGSFFRIFKRFGILDISVFTDYGFNMGILSEMTILSFALGNRINTIKQEEEKEKALIRSRIASDLHDEIGSNLSSISLSSQLIKKSSNLSDKIKNQLEEITITTKETADSIRDIIWFINPEHDKADNLLSKMQDTATRMLPGLNYTFINNNKINIKNLQSRRNLFLIYKEILNNIAKHSEAKNVFINIEDNPSSFQLKINDDGKSFDKENIKHGNGLKNIRKRVNELNGKLEVESKIDTGTLISITKKK